MHCLRKREISNMDSAIVKNVLANFIGKICTVVISLAFVPVYVKIMGEEAYAIVTFFAVMQSVLNIMGVGLQRTLRREFAKNGNDIDCFNRYKYKILRSSEFIYFIVFVIIFFICNFSSDYIVEKWISYSTLDSFDIARAITLMGVSIGLQIIANLYAGGLYGLNLQVLANELQIGWMILKNAGVIPILIFTNGSIFYFYAWMTLVDFTYSIILRMVVIKPIPTNSKKIWMIRDLSILRGLWKYAGGLFFISIGTAFSTQLDKIILSSSLSLTDCGAYNLAFNLGSFSVYIPTIIGTAIFSNVTNLIFQNKKNEAKKLFEPMNKIAVIFVTIMSTYIALFSYEIILVWTGSQIYANAIRDSAPFVVFGFMLNAYQQVPYDYLLAQGITTLNKRMLLFSIPYVCTVTLYLTKSFGLMGASVAWFMQLLIITTVYLLAFYRISFNQNGLLWLLKDVYGIFVLVFIPALIFRFVLNHLYIEPFIIIVFAVIAGSITLLLMLFYFEQNTIRRLMFRYKNGGKMNNETNNC